MKLFIATVLCAALSAEACGRSPRIVYERCVSSGDPHYTPVHGKRQKFTRMGEGEFTLAALPAYTKNGVSVGDFGVHACQHDVSKSSRTGSMKTRTITWNRDVVAWEGTTKVEISSQETGSTHGKVIITQANVEVRAENNVFKRGTSFSFGNKNSDVIVRKASRRSNRMDIKFKSGRTLRVSWYHKKTGRFGNRKHLNVEVRMEKNNLADGKRWYGNNGEGLCYLLKSQAKTVTHEVAVTNTKFTGGRCGIAPVVGANTVDLTVAIDALIGTCPRLINTAYKKCGNDAEVYSLWLVAPL